jgi:hypothetical protein
VSEAQRWREIWAELSVCEHPRQAAILLAAIQARLVRAGVLKGSKLVQTQVIGTMLTCAPPSAPWRQWLELGGYTALQLP